MTSSFAAWAATNDRTNLCFSTCPHSTSLSLIFSPLCSAYAENPTGGNVVAGAASISSTGSVLNVNAATSRTVVDWQTFSIGAGNVANFNLPSSSSAILNRVVTPNAPTAIHGQLNSNGNVFLVIPVASWLAQPASSTQMDSPHQPLTSRTLSL